MKKSTALLLAVLLVLYLCACAQSAPPAEPEKEIEIPVFGEYTGLTAFLEGTADDPLVLVVYMPGKMGGTQELYVTDADAVNSIADGLGSVSIDGATYSTVTDWYPSITLQKESGASLCISFDGNWLAGRNVNYTLSGMDSVWKLINQYAKEPEPLVCGDFTYEPSGESAAEITGYLGAGGAVTVPETLDGYTVTSVGSKAFYSSKDITEIVLPATVNSIGREAFEYCDGLTKLEIRCTDLVIGSGAFEYCHNLHSVEIAGESITVNKAAFSYCEVLSYVKLSGTSVCAGKGSFEYCRALADAVLLGTETTVIEDGAFGYCEHVSFTVPAGSEAEAYCREKSLPYTCA